MTVWQKNDFDPTVAHTWRIYLAMPIFHAFIYLRYQHVSGVKKWVEVAYSNILCREIPNQYNMISSQGTDNFTYM